MSEQPNNSGTDDLFPEPVHYSSTDCAGWSIRDWATAEELLSGFHPADHYFAIFTLPDGSYVQCYGCDTVLTVEARLQYSNGAFAHLVFGSGPLRGMQVPVGPPVGPEGQCVTVDESQILTMSDARLIIKQFLKSRTFLREYLTQDVTAQFQR